MSLGVGALLAKIDIKAAYRIVPIHPTDRPLLGIKWRDQYYVDTKLPFGLRSAPKIFNALADALEWCLKAQGVRHIDHYLDDFITYGPPNSQVCADNLRTIREVTAKLGVPLAEDKCAGPASSLVFLGIVINTVEGTLSLPEEKLTRIHTALDQWGQKRFCRRRELESLLGLLHHAVKVIPPGRSFLQRMLALLQAGPKDRQFIRLNKEFRADVMWWKVFCRVWNGVSLLQVQKPGVELTTDASGSWGCGAIWNNQWFQFQWPNSEIAGRHITYNELLPIVLAVLVWGQVWRGHHLHCRCDNEAVVVLLGSRHSRQADLMQLLRALFFFEAYFQLHITAAHIPGHTNVLADHLSRNQLVPFHLQAPQMNSQPMPTPLMAPDLVLDPGLEWSSPRWIQLFKTTVGQG
jgi:hypothetical protein